MKRWTLLLMLAALPCRAQVFVPVQDLTITPNAYGLGVNQDQYGRRQQYLTRQARPIAPIFQGSVKRDAYGLGIHQDVFGRPVFDGVMFP